MSHEYVEDEYHNQHVADGGRRTWQHPPTKLMAPIQRVKPARLLMSPSNTNGKQTEIKEEEIQWYRTKSKAFEIWANQNLLIFSEDWCCKHPIICRADQRNLQLVFTNASPEDKVTLQHTGKKTENQFSTNWLKFCSPQQHLGFSAGCPK